MYTRLVLFTLAGFALWALGRNRTEPEAPETAHGASTLEPYASDTGGTRAREKRSFSKRRLATSLTFATLFFAGAALSAGAGDMVAEMVEGSDQPAAAETTTAEASSEEAPPAEPPAAPEQPAAAPAAPADESAAPAEEPAPAEENAQGGSDGGSQGDDAPAADPADADGGDQPAEGDGGADDGADAGGDPTGGSDEPADEEPAPAPKDDEPAQSSESDSGSEAEHEDALPAEAPATTSDDAEFDAGFATVWLHRALPDPTPPAKRLSPAFARLLFRTAKSKDVDWALLLGVLRAEHHGGREPATRRELVQLAREFAALNASEDPWNALLSWSGRTSFADRATALTRYHHAVGLWALVTGLQAAKSKLEDRVLFDSRIDIYPGGVADIQSGRVNVRVLVLLRYMAEAHGQVTVSSLKTGHGFFARPGVPSAHMYGLAVDISGLEGKPIMGNQEPHGLTERAVRNILLLPMEMQPKQVISLLGLGGPSFPLANHYDHIHVGY